MNVLLLSATDGEVGILKDYLNSGATIPHNVTLLVGGVGAIATTFSLTRALMQQRYDLVIQAGVGGSFDAEIPLGAVVQVTAERYGDIGAEDHDDYIDIFDMGLIDPDKHPHSNSWLVSPPHSLAESIALNKVTGLTINTVSGNEHTIAMRRSRFGCQVESMEGAAFHYVCLQLGVPFVQIRGISNYVIPRDKSQWRMKDAIINLNNWLIDFLGRA